jgi:putative ABC transport system permease protein
MRSFLTSLAIIIGTASVIAVIGIGSSANAALEAQIDDLGGRTLSVQPSQRSRGAVTIGVNPLVIKDAEALAKNKEHDWQISPTMTSYRQIKFKKLKHESKGRRVSSCSF